MDREDFIRMRTALDQLGAAYGEFARPLYVLFGKFIEEGFTREESLTLTRDILKRWSVDDC